MNQYGNTTEGSGYPLAAWIWGHRLRVGQHWMEYLLEFLNVLAGFEYQLGQGIEGDSRRVLERYQRFSRLGLRRFVFYDEQEKTRHVSDTAAIERLQQTLDQASWLATADASNEPPFYLARKLLRSFSAIEEQRSWYAKSLLPAHHDMLFWEALRKGATKTERTTRDSEIDESSYDAGVSYTDRNFFARGGELYYLMLSAGTRSTDDVGATIETALRTLLCEQNPSLGELARSIDAAWQTIVQADDASNTGTLGWLPDPNCALYAQIATETAELLRAPLDSLEMLDLLAHLISFQLVLYIYHRAQPGSNTQAHATGACLEHCRPVLLLDIEQSEQAIRNVSAATFRDQDTLIRQKALRFLREHIALWRTANPTLSAIDSEARAHFGLRLLRHVRRNQLDTKLNSLEDAVGAGTLSFDQALERYTGELEAILMEDFDKNFKGVHTKLAKAIGLVAPYKGPNPRYVLSDRLLRAITFALVPAGSHCTYHHFLQELYQRYGIVIGYQEARKAGLVERHRINSEYYQRNAAAFLEKLQHAGLAVEYSDATALVFGSRLKNN